MNKWNRTLITLCNRLSIVLALEMGIACILALLAGEFFAELLKMMWKPIYARTPIHDQFGSDG